MGYRINLKQVKKDIAGIIATEIKRIKNDPDLQPLVNQSQINQQNNFQSCSPTKMMSPHDSGNEFPDSVTFIVRG